MKQILLTGQPNSGKSTFFNSLTGYKALTGNFPGATVSYQKGSLNLMGTLYSIVDLPGAYSLIPNDKAELETKKFIINEQDSTIVNVVDASVMSRSLEMTIELIELQRPMVVALNMVDSARKKGIRIDSAKLSRLLDLPVVETVANHGRGTLDVIRATHGAKAPSNAATLHYQRDVEQEVLQLADKLPDDLVRSFRVPKRTVAIRLLENDPFYVKELKRYDEILLKEVENSRHRLEAGHDRPANFVIAAERHNLAMSIFEQVTSFERTKPTLESRLDTVILHPFWGYLILISIFYLFFTGVFKTGAYFEGWILTQFQLLEKALGTWLPLGLWRLITNGFVQGLGAGLGIAVPYIIPFLVGLSFLEDTGYMARIAFLADSIMHKIGLHGKAIIPFVLGYGCSVPAVMAARNLESQRDRVIAASLAVMVPCSARTVIIFGLLGYYLGPGYAIGLYILNILVIGALGRLAAMLDPRVSPGLVLEIPAYHMPSLKNIAAKTWIRLKDFFTVVIPFLIIGTIALGIMEYYHLDKSVNHILSPLTVSVLGLPKAVGTTLIFGIFKKELSLMMLFQALGTNTLTDVMTIQQIVTFSVFTVFYVPCISTIAVLYRETGWKNTLYVIFGTTGLAILLAVAARIVMGVLL
ncbi:MAG: ferrous iron transport protein B [Acidobacteria bacterium]|nr:ferrous iron transport protein B [Acidobacteriota bacterium]